MRLSRIPAPGHNFSFEYNPFDFSAFVQVQREGSRVVLESRRDGDSIFSVRSIPAAHLPLKLQDCFVRDRPSMESEVGPIEVISSDANDNEEKIEWKTLDRHGARYLKRRERGGAIFITGSCPLDADFAPSSVVSLLAESLREELESKILVHVPVSLSGAVKRVRDGKAVGVCVDVLVGRSERDIFVQSITFQASRAADNHMTVFQGRQLQLFSRVISDGSVNWNSRAVPMGGYGLIQLPVIDIPTGFYPKVGTLIVSGWYEDGEEIFQSVSLNDLCEEVRLLRPVPDNWQMINGPEKVSLHRLAARIDHGCLYVPQRGAIDFKAPGELSNYHINESLLQDFPSYGQPVNAPCDGTVLYYRDDLPDQLPGNRDVINSRGNEIHIAMENGQVVILAHLKYGSVRIKVNDMVKKGDFLAAVGNSGNSSEPHLHLHVANNTGQFANGTLITFDE